VHHIPEGHRLVRELLSVYSELTGLEAYTIAIGGGTYARMIPNAVAFGCAFPGDADCAHMPDESVDIDKLLLCCRIMAHAIVRLAG
jgi:succinyl-diaminopimelate desuccinylase